MFRLNTGLHLSGSNSVLHLAIWEMRCDNLNFESAVISRKRRNFKNAFDAVGTITQSQGINRGGSASSKRPNRLLVQTWVKPHLSLPQQLASLSMVELCKAASGEEGCTVAEEDELEVLLTALESSSSSLRFAALQGFLHLSLVLPGPEEGSGLGERVARRFWVARFDVNEENVKLGKRYASRSTELKTVLVCRFLCLLTLFVGRTVGQLAVGQSVGPLIGRLVDYMRVHWFVCSLLWIGHVYVGR